MIAKGLQYIVVLLFLISFTGYSNPAQENEKSSALNTLAALEQAVGDSQDEVATELAEELHSEVKEEGTPLVSGDMATFLVFPKSPAKKVRIFGQFDVDTGNSDLNLKHIGGLNVWVGRYRIPLKSEFLYNIDIDGKITEDPLCKRWLMGFGKHSIGRMAGFDPWVDRAVEADVPRGIIEKFDLVPKDLPATRTIQIYLPPDYAKSDQRYPILYVHDGAQALTDGKLDKIVDFLIHNKKMHSIILCFVPPHDRMQEYGFQDERYGKFLVNEVVPEIDKRYRTLTDRENRGVTGSSMGGRISLYLVENYTDTFGICIAQSTWLEENSKILNYINENPAIPVRFYIDVGVFEREVGDRDLVALNEEIYTSLKDKGYDVVNRVWPGGHCWLMWSRSLGEAFPIIWPAEVKK